MVATNAILLQIVIFACAAPSVRAQPYTPENLLAKCPALTDEQLGALRHLPSLPLKPGKRSPLQAGQSIRAGDGCVLLDVGSADGVQAAVTALNFNALLMRAKEAVDQPDAALEASRLAEKLKKSIATLKAWTMQADSMCKLIDVKTEAYEEKSLRAISMCSALKPASRLTSRRGAVASINARAVHAHSDPLLGLSDTKRELYALMEQNDRLIKRAMALRQKIDSDQERMERYAAEYLKRRDVAHMTGYFLTMPTPEEQEREAWPPRNPFAPAPYSGVPMPACGTHERQLYVPARFRDASLAHAAQPVMHFTRLPLTLLHLSHQLLNALFNALSLRVVGVDYSLDSVLWSGLVGVQLSGFGGAQVADIGEPSLWDFSPQVKQLYGQLAVRMTADEFKALVHADLRGVARAVFGLFFVDEARDKDAAALHEYMLGFCGALEDAEDELRNFKRGMYCSAFAPHFADILSAQDSSAFVNEKLLVTLYGMTYDAMHKYTQLYEQFAQELAAAKESVQGLSNRIINVLARLSKSKSKGEALRRAQRLVKLQDVIVDARSYHDENRYALNIRDYEFRDEPAYLSNVLLQYPDKPEETARFANIFGRPVQSTSAKIAV